MTTSVFTLAVLCLLVLPKISVAGPIQTVWFGGTGVWSSSAPATNWSNGLPSAGSQAIINGGTATLNYSTPLLDSVAICSAIATCPGSTPELIVNSSLSTDLIQSYGGLTINSGGLVTVQSPGLFGFVQETPAFTLVNANGTFNDNGYYSQGGGTTTVYGLLTTTLINITGGIITTGGGGTLNDSGSYTQGFGSVQNNINAGGQMNIAGAYSQGSGNTNVFGILNANGGFNVTAGAVMTYSGGVLNVTGNYTQSAPVNNTINPGGNMNVSGTYGQGGGSTSVGGTITVGQGFSVTGGTVLVGNGGLVEVTSGNYAQGVAGTMTTINYGGEISVDNGDYDQEMGTSTIIDGFLNANNLNNSGLVTGDGTVSAEVFDLGTVNAGDQGFGTLTILGDYTQTGFLDSDFVGTGQFDGDFLAVDGCASLNGTVDVTFDGGFTPTIGEIFPVMSFDQCPSTGTFNNVVGHGLAPGESLIAIYSSTGAAVEVVGSSATPEPPSFVMAALALISCLGFRGLVRRKYGTIPT